MTRRVWGGLLLCLAPACLMLQSPLMQAEIAEECGHGGWWESAYDLGSTPGITKFDTPAAAVDAYCNDTAAFGAVKWTAPTAGIWSFVANEGSLGVSDEDNCVCVGTVDGAWSGRVERSLKAEETVYMLVGPLGDNDTGIGGSVSLGIYECRDTTGESGPTPTLSEENTSFAWDGPFAKSVEIVDESGASMWRLECDEDDSGVGVDCISWPLAYGEELAGARNVTAPTALSAGANYTMYLSYSCWDGQGESGLGADDIYEVEFPFTL